MVRFIDLKPQIRIINMDFKTTIIIFTLLTLVSCASLTKEEQAKRNNQEAIEIMFPEHLGTFR